MTPSFRLPQPAVHPSPFPTPCALPRLQHPGTHLQLVGPVLFLVCDVFLLISVAALAIAQASQVARNVTTNELANWHRCGARAGMPGAALEGRWEGPKLRFPAQLVFMSRYSHASSFLLICHLFAALSPRLPCVFLRIAHHLLYRRRYKYMHSADGDFYNPFDKGWKRNCVETCQPHAAPASPYVLRRACPPALLWHA